MSPKEFTATQYENFV